MSTTPVPGNFDEVNKRITRIEKEISALTVITRSEALLVSYVDVTKFGYERQSYKQMFLDLSKKLIVVDISEKIRSVIKLSSNKENEHQFVVNLLDAELLKLYSGKDFGKKIRELNAERGTRLTISKYQNKVELTNREKGLFYRKKLLEVGKFDGMDVKSIKVNNEAYLLINGTKTSYKRIEEVAGIKYNEAEGKPRRKRIGEFGGPIDTKKAKK
ncbi:unnamed protein product, partial [Mesorhabditis spiculigera]